MPADDLLPDSPRIRAQGRALLEKLLRSGDDGSVTLGAEAAEVALHLAQRRLVAVEIDDAGYVLRLRRNDRAA